MPKAYTFRFYAQKADFMANGVVGISLPETVASEVKVATFADAPAYLAEFSAKTPAPHAAFMRMRYPNDRKPPGFDKAKTVIYKEG